MRHLHLDGLRGVMLISMALSHFGSNLPLGMTQSLVFKAGLINDAASAFIFLSGLTVALVYTKGWLDPEYAYRKQALGKRTWLIFHHHAFLVVLATLLATWMLALDRHIWIFDRFGDLPVLFGLVSLLMLAGGYCLDILPLYILFLLLTPAAIVAATSGRRWLVIATVGAAWLVGQMGLLEAGWSLLGTSLGLESRGIVLGLEFNRLSWSAFYFSGLLFGCAYVRGEFDLATLRQPRFAVALLACFALIVGSMLVLMLYLRGIVIDHKSVFDWLISKHSVGILALLNFLACAYVVTWLLVAGPTSPYPSMRALGSGLSRMLKWQPLVLLGQHSLLVFTFHVTAIYVLHLLIEPDWFNPWTANAILLVCVLSLFIPVLIGRHLKTRKPPLAQAEPAMSGS